MIRIAVIGYGSKIRNDDAAGIRVVDILKKRLKSYQNVQFFYGFNNIDLLGRFDEFDRFYIIDCAFISKEPGKFLRGNIEEINFTDDSMNSHTTNFTSLVKDAKDMGIAIPEIFFYLIQPKNTEIGERMDKEVQRGLKGIVKAIETEIKEEMG
ncbi:MAG: hydrogenase maturation protease [Nanoarchaeota archaeon]